MRDEASHLTEAMPCSTVATATALMLQILKRFHQGLRVAASAGALARAAGASVSVWAEASAGSLALWAAASAVASALRVVASAVVSAFGVVQVRTLNDFRPAAGRAGRGCFGRRSGSDTSFVGASAPKKILGDFLVLPSLPAHPPGFVK